MGKLRHGMRRARPIAHVVPLTLIRRLKRLGLVLGLILFHTLGCGGPYRSLALSQLLVPIQCE